MTEHRFIGVLMQISDVRRLERWGRAIGWCAVGSLQAVIAANQGAGLMTCSPGSPVPTVRFPARASNLELRLVEHSVAELPSPCPGHGEGCGRVREHGEIRTVSP